MSVDTTRVYTAEGKVAHLTTQGTVTLCGMWYPSGFYGTGSQDEYEKAEALRTCLRCYVKDGGA